MSQFIQTHFPNRTKTRRGTAAGTGWVIWSSDGVAYSDYPTLLAAGKDAWPGKPADFPIGVPAMNIRTTNAAGTGDGSVVLVKTNTTMTPVDAHDVDFVVSGSGQQLSPPGGIKMLWTQQVTGGDYVIFTGMF